MTRLLGSTTAMGVVMADEGESKDRPDLDLSFLARQPARARDIPNLTSGADREAERREAGGRSVGGDGRTLTVGKDISLSGDIAACDTLIVEGNIDVSLNKARALEIARTGTFKGNARVENAVVSGRFDGDLTVENGLRITATGWVNGRVRYKRLEIENGGELHGDVSVHS